MSTKKKLTDEQVEIEIERLKKSPEVKLAQLEERIRYRRRIYLYRLQSYEREGKRLMDAGVTEEILRNKDLESEE